MRYAVGVPLLKCYNPFGGLIVLTLPHGIGRTPEIGATAVKRYVLELPIKNTKEII